jgi:hypothetical protein
MLVERGSTKHGPHQDEAMAHEVEGYVRAGGSTRSEAWRSPEPPDDDVTDAATVRRVGPPAAARPESMSPQDVQDRSELARWLGRAVFPAGRDEVIDHLRAQNAPESVVASVFGAPADARFGSSGELWRALHGGENVETHRY